MESDIRVPMTKEQLQKLENYLLIAPGTPEPGMRKIYDRVVDALREIDNPKRKVAIIAARVEYEEDDIGIDDDATLLETDADGSWVQGWVHIPGWVTKEEVQHGV